MGWKGVGGDGVGREGEERRARASDRMKINCGRTRSRREKVLFFLLDGRGKIYGYEGGLESRKTNAIEKSKRDETNDDRPNDDDNRSTLPSDEDPLGAS